MLVSSNWASLLKKQAAETKVPSATRRSGSGVATTIAGSAPADDARPSKKPRKRVDRAPAPKVVAPVNPVVAAAAAAGNSKTRGVMPNCVAIDCEMVGVGPEGERSILARCSLVDYEGKVLYDKFVTPMEKVTDYRTHVSGVTPAHLSSPLAVDFKVCQIEVADILKDRVLVGHALHHDLEVLMLPHPRHLIRDTSRYRPFCPKKPRSLKALVEEKLHLQIQGAAHDSVEDARCVMALYKSVRKQWEAEVAQKQARRALVAASKQQKQERRDAAYDAEVAASHAMVTAARTAPIIAPKPTKAIAPIALTRPVDPASAAAAASAVAEAAGGGAMRVTFSRPNNKRAADGQLRNGAKAAPGATPAAPRAAMTVSASSTTVASADRAAIALQRRKAYIRARPAA